MSALWKYRGQERPPFARTPSLGEESVWDYPRPPRIAPDTRHVVIRNGPLLLADSRRAVRVLETASPPTFYLPATDVCLEHLVVVPGQSVCEWKGTARYWSLRDAPERGAVAWSYPTPTSPFAEIAGYLAFYPGRLACDVDGERVRPQPGRFYGGWVTRELAGPFKGEPGTEGW